MAKYDKLRTYLQAQPSDEVSMRFADIEHIIGAKLPPKAQFHRAWWSNSASNSVMTKAWLDAGFRSERVDMAGRKLVFRRVAQPATTNRPVSGMEDEAREFKPAEADTEKKPRRSPLFGCMKGTFTLVPPGPNEPPPEDPDSWEALCLAKFDRLLFGIGE
jgi:hypothetical protein